MLKGKSTFVLLSSLFIIMVGFGIIIPVLPYYSQDLGATSLDLGLLMAAYSLMQFIFAPLWGTLSDRWGRKPVLLIGLAGFALSFFIFGLANSLWVLFAARILGGLLSAAAMPTVMAVIGDTTTNEQRAQGMGMMGAAMGLGMIFGPAIGGILAKFGPHTPFMVAAGMALITVIYAAIFMPETLDKTKAPKVRKQGLNFLDTLKGPLAFLMVLAFTVSFANANLEATFAYFSKDKFGFGPTQMGIAFAIMGITSVILQGLLVGKIINFLGEQKVIVYGLGVTAIAFVCIILAPSIPSLIFFLTLSGLGMSLVRPGLTTLISKRAVTGQGETMGTMSSFDSIGRIAGPVFGGEVYLYHQSYPYWAGALIIVGMMLLAVVKFKMLYKCLHNR